MGMGFQTKLFLTKNKLSSVLVAVLVKQNQENFYAWKFAIDPDFFFTCLTVKFIIL